MFPIDPAWHDHRRAGDAVQRCIRHRRGIARGADADGAAACTNRAMRCPWVPPSPNMPTPDTALAYPGTALFEGTNVSEGAAPRGRSKPSARRSSMPRRLPKNECNGLTGRALPSDVVHADILEACGRVVRRRAVAGHRSSMRSGLRAPNLVLLAALRGMAYPDDFAFQLRRARRSSTSPSRWQWMGAAGDSRMARLADAIEARGAGRVDCAGSKALPSRIPALLTARGAARRTGWPAPAGSASVHQPHAVEHPHRRSRVVAVAGEAHGRCGR